MKEVAVRNIRLCTKDCICLYVCPTGATDTEDSIIDVEKCIGCGACFKACPSSAISMVPLSYPIQQKKTDRMINTLNSLSLSKAKGEGLARNIKENSTKDGLSRLMKAFEKSQRLVQEDILREAGFMLPQSNNTHKLLEELLNNPLSVNFPNDIANKLLSLIENNELNIKEYKCTVCGYIHKGENLLDICPICKQGKDKFILLD